MTSMLFIFSILFVFTFIFTAESEPGARSDQLLKPGLLRWIVSGNWTAKVGAGLLLLGIGALLRYALKEVEINDELKLSAGIILSALLALVAYKVRVKPDRKGVYFALVGAAAGVAYLTAYSAYGFFNYINEFNALALLAMVAVVTGVFAVNAKSLSVAILSMTGAYLAPAFAIENSTTFSIFAVYGYYILISSLCLIMVTLRGWRGLIHLSFVFTLAGALFFGWTSQFQIPKYYSVMQPILLILAAIHLAMPILEHRNHDSRWLSRFDNGYFVALPLVCAILTWTISSSNQQVALGLFFLAILWGLCGLILKKLERSDAIKYALVAVLLITTSILFQFKDVPWYLIAMAGCVGILAIAPRINFSHSSQELICGILFFTGFLHVANSLLSVNTEIAFNNSVFMERMIACILFSVGAVIARKRSIGFWQALAASSAGWFLLSVAREIFKLNIDHLPQFIHVFLLILVLMTALISKRHKMPIFVTMTLTLSLVICSWWASQSSIMAFALLSAVLTPATLLYLAFTNLDKSKTNDDTILTILCLLPILIAPWIYASTKTVFIQPIYFSLIATIIGVIVSWKLAMLWQPHHSRTEGFVLPFHFLTVLGILTILVLLHIVRSAPAVIFELLSLYYLISFSYGLNTTGKSRWNGFGILSILVATLTIQAMLLRLLGPPNSNVLSIHDLKEMNMPVIVSLTWAILGAGLTWWSSKRSSRTTWFLGTAILAVSALKMAILDFGSLNQLSNIFAMIAAGIIFLLVAWFAPFPPKPTNEYTSSDHQQPGSSDNNPTDNNPTDNNPSDINPTDNLNKISENTVATDSSIENPATSNKQDDAVVPAIDTNPHEKNNKDDYLTENSDTENVLQETPIKFNNHTSPTEETEAIRERIKSASIAYSKNNTYESSAKYQTTTAKKQNNNLIIIIGLFLAIVFLVIFKSQKNSSAYITPAIQTPVTEQLPQLNTHNLSKQTPSATTSPQIAKSEDACARFSNQLNLPNQFKVYAAGGYAGNMAGFQIDQSGHQATNMEVVVNHKDMPVVLMLAAYEPTIWKIKSTTTTKILAVLVSGYHHQVVASIDRTIPVHISTYENKGECGHFLISAEQLNSLNPISQRVFGQNVDLVYPSKNGNVLIGNPLNSNDIFNISDTRPKESYTNPNAPLAGAEGLIQSINSGLIRRGNEIDRQLLSARFQDPNRPPVANNSFDQSINFRGELYVVQKQFTYPSGLYGANSVTFMIPVGVPEPSGDPGHSLVYHMESQRCTSMNNMSCIQ